jgi:tetratricopeptide (TPR) repeat protein
MKIRTLLLSALLFNALLSQAQDIPKFTPYIPQVPVNEYRKVESERQRIYDSRVAWLQNKLDEIAQLNYNLIYKLNSRVYNDLSNEIKQYLDNNVRKPIDWSDDYYFNQLVSALKSFENKIKYNYNSLVKEANSSVKNESEETREPVVQGNTDKVNKAEVYFKEAIELWKKQDARGAINKLDQSINLYSDNPYSFTLRGLIYKNELGNFDEAIKDFTKAIQLEPDSSSGYYYRGTTYYQQERPTEAIKDFTACLRIDSDNTNAYFMRGLLKSKLGDRVGAIKDYN